MEIPTNEILFSSDNIDYGISSMDDTYERVHICYDELLAVNDVCIARTEGEIGQDVYKALTSVEKSMKKTKKVISDLRYELLRYIQEMNAIENIASVSAGGENLGQM